MMDFLAIFDYQKVSETTVMGTGLSLIWLTLLVLPSVCYLLAKTTYLRLSFFDI